MEPRGVLNTLALWSSMKTSWQAEDDAFILIFTFLLSVALLASLLLLLLLLLFSLLLSPFLFSLFFEEMLLTCWTSESKVWWSIFPKMIRVEPEEFIVEIPENAPAISPARGTSFWIYVVWFFFGGGGARLLFLWVQVSLYWQAILNLQIFLEPFLYPECIYRAGGTNNQYQFS